MADIYRSCFHVNVWLPNPTRTTDRQPSGKSLLSLGALLSVLAIEHFHGIIPGYRFDEKTHILSFHETDEFRALWDGFLLLATSPWWTRAWTAQEAYLPPRVTFFHYAAEPCDIDLLIRALNREAILLGNIPPCCVKAIDVFPSQKTRTLRDFFAAVRKISDPRDIRLETRARDGRDYFYITVASFADRESHDPRDRLYSLWSTAGDSYRNLKPEYEKPEEEKPSWVPDFSRSWDPQVVRAHLDILAISRKYRASGWSRGRVEVKGAQLHLKGFFIDRIHAIGPAARNLYDPPSLKETLSQWDSMIQAFEAEQRNTTESVRTELVGTLSGGVCNEVLPGARQALLKRRFLLRNIAKVNIVRLMIESAFQKMVWQEQWRPLQPEDHPGQEELDGLFQTGDINCLRYEGYRNAVVSILLYKCLFITDNGRVGLGVDHAKAGDQVLWVYGSKVPFIFRPFNFENESAIHNMVGDCYLHGAMEGQLLWKSVKVTLV
ncbi:heterokaryon incompatibility protein-domain-containing protein [Xylaria longipes]|nr:heterokaryon incompatibility protein-domain-containing protein [Xylaria longipes]